MPVASKVFPDVKFFLKNSETTRAFTQIPFTGSAGNPVYPNANFNNQHDNSEPYVNLVTLSNLYELKAPTLLGLAEVSGSTVTAYTGSEGLFDNVGEDNYLLYRLDSDDFFGAADTLRVLGYIQSKTNGDEVILTDTPPSETTGQILEVFSWEGEVTAETLETLNFNFQDNFYMVVKNADYTGSNHNGVLYIDTARTSSNYTNNPQPFAYSTSKLINPNYFKLQRISEIKKPYISEVDVTNIPCSIKGVSKWSEKELFENSLTSIAQNTIPYWSVYEINPHTLSSTNLEKKTFYRLEMGDTLPSSQIYVNVGESEA